MVTGSYQEVELSLTENLIPVTVPVKQYDNKARKVRCVLYNNSVEYTVPQNCIGHICNCRASVKTSLSLHLKNNMLKHLFFILIKLQQL